MFNPSVEDVRNFFYDTYIKGKNQEVLTDMGKIAFSVILEHPEYHDVLDNKARYFDYQWSVESGATNPFLHMSLHITIHEQLSVDQPPGIKELYAMIKAKHNNYHDVMHEMIDCLGEMIWQAQKNQKAPEVSIYFNCLKSKIKDV